jgi:hypothetical protein
MRLPLSILLVAFTAFSLWVCATRGYFGFLRLASHDRWALQMLLDLTIALVLGTSWLVKDARRRGITAWPYVVATIALGSIAILAYLIRRSRSVLDARNV